jgi:hypothetical protein
MIVSKQEVLVTSSKRHRSNRRVWRPKRTLAITIPCSFHAGLGSGIIRLASKPKIKSSENTYLEVELDYVVNIRNFEKNKKHRAIGRLANPGSTRQLPKYYEAILPVLQRDEKGW